MYLESLVHNADSAMRVQPFVGGRVGIMTGKFMHARTGVTIGGTMGFDAEVLPRLRIEMVAVGNIVYLTSMQVDSLRKLGRWATTYSFRSGVLVGIL